MEKIIWNEKYSVGLAEIDKQHKKLIVMINKLIDSRNVSVRSEIISDTLTDMTNYAMYHFQAEEALMEEHEYPRQDAHHKEHMGFIRKTAELASATVEHEQAVPEELLAYLGNWLIAHILKSDMGYKDFFKDKGII